MPAPNFNSLIMFMVVAVALSCTSTGKRFSDTSQEKSDSVVQTVYESQILDLGVGWGYQITQNHKVIIHQPTIPAVSGNNPFVSEEQAMAVATLVINKLNKGHMPPSVTRHELDSLRITY